MSAVRPEEDVYVYDRLRSFTFVYQSLLENVTHWLFDSAQTHAHAGWTVLRSTYSEYQYCTTVLQELILRV